MSAKNIQSRNCSVLRAQGIKRSIMGSALLAGLASTALLYTQAALAQDTASASNNANLSISTSTVPAGTISVSAKSVGGGQASLVKNPVLPAKTSQNIEKYPRHLTRASKVTTPTPTTSARLQKQLAASSLGTQTPAPIASPVPQPASTAPTAPAPTQNNNDDVIPIKDSDLKWFFYLNITKSNDYNEDTYNKWQLTNKIVNDTTEIAVHTYGVGTKYYNLSTTDKLDSEEGLELLKRFTHLKKLDVSDCKIANADKLLNVLPANLESLMLGKHSSLLPSTEDTATLTDTTKLNRFTKLTSLSLKSVTLNSTNFLSNMKDLEDLNLSSTNIHDISSLKNCTKLKKLDISCNDISNISALRSLTQLTDLSIKYNKVTSLDGLEACTKLVRLKAKNNAITSLEPLQALTSIQKLSLSNNKIASLKPLRQLTNLKKLKIESNAISNVAPLAGLVKSQTLTVINAKDNHIADVSSIYGALPEKIGNTDLRRAGDFSYDFTFQTFTFDYKDGSTLDSYGIKAGPSGFDYGDTGTDTGTINAYTGSAYISFSTKDKVDAFQKGNRLLQLPRIVQKFDFAGTMSIYRYRPQLKYSTPLEVDFGAAAPSVEDIRARVTLLHGDTYPKNGRYFLSVGTRDPYPDSPYVQSQQPGALQQLVEVNTFKSGDFQPIRVYVIYYKNKTTKTGDNNSFTDNIDVPVYVKTMAESYAPKTLTLEPGKTLTQKELEDACIKRIPFTFITKDEAEAHPDKYQQADEENSNSNVWVDPDALSGPDDNPKPNQIFCTRPQFTWGSITSVSATAADEGKVKYVPVTITYADGSTWKGNIEIDVPKPVQPHNGSHDGTHDGTHTPGGGTDDDNPSGTGTDGTGDTDAGTGTTNGNDGNGTTNGNDGTDNHGAGNDTNGTTNGNAQPGTHNGSYNGTYTKRGRHFRHAYWQSNVANAGAGLHAGAGTDAGATNGDNNQATNADGTSTSTNNGTNGSGSTEGNGSANSSVNATAQQAPTADSDVAMHDETPLSWLLARMRESGFYVLAAIIVCACGSAWYATAKKRNAAGEQPAAPKK